MSFSYDLATNLGQVRLLIPDVDSTAYDLEDEEITYFLAQVGSNVKAAAVQACNWLARKYAKKVSFNADGLRVDNQQRAAEFAARAKELKAEMMGGMSAVSLTRSDGYTENATTDDYENRTIYIKV